MFGIPSFFVLFSDMVCKTVCSFVTECAEILCCVFCPVWFFHIKLCVLQKEQRPSLTKSRLKPPLSLFNCSTSWNLLWCKFYLFLKNKINCATALPEQSAREKHESPNSMPVGLDDTIISQQNAATVKQIAAIRCPFFFFEIKHSFSCVASWTAGISLSLS